MRNIARYIPVLLIALAASLPLRADIAFPTVTKVYFSKDGQPFQQAVDFTVSCYGYRVRPGPEMGQPHKPAGSYTPESVYSFSAHCPAYGCEIYENFYLNYRVIEYCSVNGKADGKDFKIEKYADSPVDFSACKNMEDSKFKRSCTLKFSLPN